MAIHEIITHRIPFANWPDAFTLARDGHDRALKIALTFPEAA
jgi:threonine dehydrogenase-like Zn-dependent dehydrogenase